MNIETNLKPELKRNHETMTSAIHKSGTGFMVCLSDTIRELEKEGYTENLVPSFDHLCCRSGAIRLYPDDIKIDKMVRFEVASDPDDQAILYAISCPSQNIRGLYVDSYGVYHDELSSAMIRCFRECPAC